ncbi:hypothetical protein CN918_26055 [Priestia megaterium]|nr:hypothetical protein CN918_26055 [Priestia megaterium]
MNKYKIRLTNNHVYFYEDGDNVIYFEALDDYEAHDKACSILLKHDTFKHGILSTYLTGRISMKHKPGFCDYLVLTHSNENIQFSE